MTVEGSVTLSGENRLEWATRIATRYMPDHLAEATGRRNAVPEELIVRLSPHRLLGRADVAS